MKNYITLAMLLISTLAIAQQKVDKFKITPEGFNGFVVKDFPDKTAADLYTEIKKWGEYTQYKAEENKTSSIDGEYLSYKLYQVNQIEVNNTGQRLYWDIQYLLEIRFKDDKLRIDITLERMPPAANNSATNVGDFQLRGGFLNWSFYNKKGKPKKITASAREDVENFASDVVVSLEDAINKGADSKSGDW
ncbi:hypothetical protein ACE939_00915 [Aquimarina sp. W85]|uniref:hypothetical protein n=1 Tax=Aquimarina rhodophyticola TaxID=3342246 RepID=UPI00366ED8E2